MVIPGPPRHDSGRPATDDAVEHDLASDHAAEIKGGSSRRHAPAVTAGIEGGREAVEGAIAVPSPPPSPPPAGDRSSAKFSRGSSRKLIAGLGSLLRSGKHNEPPTPPAAPLTPSQVVIEPARPEPSTQRLFSAELGVPANDAQRVTVLETELA